MNPRSAYAVLLRSYGPQGWWPVTPRGGTRPAYRPGWPRAPTESEAQEIAVGAILTQNTAWGNVERALESLNDAGGPRLARLRRMPLGRLEGSIRSSGYFRQKALKLRHFADALAAKGGSLARWLRGELPRVREELLAVRGVGPETADSILLYAGSRESFVVDAYTLRIGARVGWFGAAATYAHAQSLLSGSLAVLGRGPRGRVRVFQEFHALLVQLAKLHCRTAPLCSACPLRRGCRHGNR